MLIVFAGLPGTGKTTLASALASRLHCAHVRIDAIGSALRRAGATPDPGNVADYIIAEAVADTTLRAGVTVIIDAVNPVVEARSLWHGLAQRHEVPLRIIELICSDQEEHRRRVELREWDTSELKNPTWADVLTREYEPWDEAHLTLDTSLSIEKCLDSVLAYVNGETSGLTVID